MMRTTKPFNVYNVSPVVDRTGVEVGQVQIHRRKAWHDGRPSYQFRPNAEGARRGLTPTSVDGNLRALLAGLEETDER